MSNTIKDKKNKKPHLLLFFYIINIKNVDPNKF